MTTYSTIHVDVTASTPRFHCHHTRGRLALIVHDDPHVVYLAGTPEDLLAWADAVSIAVLDAPPHEDESP
jgi:hypothetical protein